MGDVAQPARRAVRRRGVCLVALLGCAAVMALAADRLPAHGVRAPAGVVPAQLADGAHVGGGVDSAQSSATGAMQTPQASGAGDEQQARITCGGCHAFPPPEIMPRHMWRDEFVRMMFIRDNRLPPLGPANAINRTIQLPADMEQALPYFVSRAPERLPLPDAWPAVTESPVRFTRTAVPVPPMPASPAISSVQLVQVDGDNRPAILATDMRQGLILLGRPQAGGGLTTVASIPHPARATRTDVDGDGIQDLLVADLGAFFPADHDKGAVIWLRGLASGKFGAFWLDGWPRVAGVESADFNGDGRKDLLVAAFGWRRTGEIAIMENRTSIPTRPEFTKHTIDPRPGAIHALPVDLNSDGHMDFVSLLAQQHESVVAYLNTGTPGFAFEQKVIYAAPHPNWGSSGIQLVDLDKDGDLDVILTHGDTFDDGLVKPYHGIQWLENKGSYPFVEHTLASMPGVHRAVAADLDGDGDLDIAAAALLAAGADVDEATLPAIIWLEQTRPGTFARHTIAMGAPRHATLDAGDVDGDGDIDLVTGTFSVDHTTGTWIETWLNQRAQPTAK